MPSFDPVEVAGRLLGRDALTVGRIEGGRNAEVWRVDAGGAAYALKRYVRSDPAGRLARETAALRFLERHGVEAVARLVAADAESDAILMRWVPGRSVAHATEGDVLACVDFLVLLRGLSRAVDARALPEATEACGSVAAILEQIDMRISRIAALSGRDASFRHFIDAELLPRRRALNSLQHRYPGPFPRESRTLSPSDFGVHNALRAESGRLTFLDFEYFGWDDPAKLTADFILHPGMNLPDRLTSPFAGRMRALFGEEDGFAERVAALMPAYRLRWALIMLNPVLDAAGEAADEIGTFNTVVRTQTERAARYLREAPLQTREERKSHVG